MRLLPFESACVESSVGESGGGDGDSLSLVSFVDDPGD